MTLPEFLLARIAEDEAAARAAMDVAPTYPHFGDTAYEEMYELAVSEGAQAAPAAHAARHYPARMLAECEAKRRIVERCGSIEDHWAFDDERALADQLLGMLTLPYADHPDCRDEWRPSGQSTST